MTDQTPPLRKSDRWIPYYFVLFFIVVGLCLGVMVTIALRTYPGVVTENAYEKGLHYNAMITAQAEQDKAGWSSSLTASLDPMTNQAHVTVTLKDQSHHPISDAQVSLWMMRPTESGIDQKMEMKAANEGVYEATIILPKLGLWEARFEAVKEGLRYQSQKRLTLTQ